MEAGLISSFRPRRGRAPTILRDGLLALVVAMSVPLFGATIAVAVGVCAHDSNHWYAQAVAGYPSTGTRVYHHLPTTGNWYVEKSSNGTSDEASWLINVNNGNVAIEGGFFTGWWPYGVVTWYSNLMPYSTLDNGLSGSKGSTALTPNTSIYMDVVTGGYAKIGAQQFNFSYSVPNGVNFSQGEVTGSTQNWMDDKVADHEFIGYLTQNFGTSWISWPGHNDCRNTPYTIVSSSYRSWYNGGGLFNK
jgi:hypothetical protein